MAILWVVRVTVVRKGNAFSPFITQQTIGRRRKLFAFGCGEVPPQDVDVGERNHQLLVCLCE